MPKLLLSLTFLLTLLLTSTQGALAYSASMYYSPSGGAQYVGSSFNVSVYVSTGGTAANSFQADIRFPSDKLDITGISTGGSICSLFPFQPSYGSGTGQIQCGIPSPGFNGSGGKLGTVTFRAKSTGTAVVTLSASSQVLANDGQGTNILTSLGSATFSITQPPTSAPTISSSSHPDQDRWYKARSVRFSFSGGYSGYSYDFNQTFETIPDQSSEGGDTAKTFDNVGDGVWYLALRGLGSSGWSGTAHFKVQIDNTPPDAFSPVVDPPGEIDRRPLVSFQTKDNLSGIDHYELKIDNGDFFKVENPYKPDRISSGDHTFTVRAYDKAGNYTDGSAKTRIKDIPSPVITSPATGYLKFLEKLVVQGAAPADSNIAVFLNDKLIGQEILVGKDGKWEYSYSETLLPAKYKLHAVVTKDGIDSRPSNEVNFTVDASVVSIGPFSFPGVLVIIFLLIIIAVILAASAYLLWHMWLKLKFATTHLRDRIRGLREEVGEDMTKLEHAVEKDVESTLQGSDSVQMREMEHTLESKIEGDIDKTKTHLKGDIDQAENELKGP